MTIDIKDILLQLEETKEEKKNLIDKLIELTKTEIHLSNMRELIQLYNKTK